jgi:uncharacterized Zn finger protein
VSSNFTAEDLWELAGDRSFQRGERYVAAVSELRVRDGELRAVVCGSEPYRVWLDQMTLEGDCECPYADQGAFCKHLVAVGLAELKGVGREVPQRSEHDEPHDEHDLESLYDYLADLERTTLIDLLLDASEEDAWLRSRLLARERRTSQEYR